MAQQRSLDRGGPTAPMAGLPDPLQAFRLIAAREGTCVRRDQLLALRKRLTGELLGEPGLVAATLSADYQMTMHQPGRSVTLDRSAVISSASYRGSTLAWLELPELSVDYRAGDYGTHDLGAGDHGALAGHGLLRMARGTRLTTTPLAFFISFDGALMTRESAFFGISVTTELADGAALPTRDQLREFLFPRDRADESCALAPSYSGTPS
jgi:hypothetical protein